MSFLFKLLKWLLALAALLLLLIALFVWWGSRNTWPEADYLQVRTFPGESKNAGDTLRILTFNIGWMSGMTNNLAVPRTKAMYHDNFSRFIRIIGSLKPDIIAVQEIDFDAHRSFRWQQVDSIALYAGYPNVAQAVNWDKRYVPFPGMNVRLHFARTVSGQAIFSRFPITGHSVVVMPRPKGPHPLYNYFYIDRLAQVVEIRVDGTTKLHCINVHLEAWDIPVRRVHGAITAHLADSLLAFGPVLAVGDFNDIPPTPDALADGTSDSTLVHMLAVPHLVPAGWSLQSSIADWHLTYSSEKPTKAIDHVFFDSRHWEAASTRVVREMGEVSDHLPLLVVLVRKEN